jgi:protein TonB
MAGNCIACCICRIGPHNLPKPPVWAVISTALLVLLIYCGIKPGWHHFAIIIQYIKSYCMSIVNKKRTLFGGFLTMALIIILASCASDTDNSSARASVTDSGKAVVADSNMHNSTATTTIKKRKGRASAMFNAGNALKAEKDKDGIYSKAEQMPEYPGGQKALSSFVENNISYPQDAVDQNTEGTVYVSFVIDEKGKVIKPMVTGKSAGHSLDDEAVKVVKQMPAWKPGLVRGKPVKTRLSLPVTFKLDA